MPPMLLRALVLVVCGVVPLGAQDQDTLPPDTAAEEPSATPPAPDYSPPRLALSVTVGRLGFGTLQRQPVMARRVTAAGEVVDSTVLSRAVEAGSGLQVGVSGVLHIDRIWAIRLGTSVGRTTVRPEYEGEAALFAATAARLAETEATEATLLTVEAALRMRIPSSHWAQPYVELGGSAMRWRTGTGIAGTPALEDGVQRLGGMAAVGLDVPVGDRIAVRFQATSRVFRTPADPAPAGLQGPASSTMTLTFTRPEPEPFADPYRELTTTLRLELGVSLALGGTVAAPRDPDVPAASPSPTRR